MPAYQLNTSRIYVSELSVGQSAVVAGPTDIVTDNVCLKADKDNAGSVFVTFPSAGVTQRFCLYAGDALNNMRISSFETFRVIASQAGQILWVYAELPNG